jgi:hypothetical protein
MGKSSSPDCSAYLPGAVGGLQGGLVIRDRRSRGEDGGASAGPDRRRTDARLDRRRTGRRRIGVRWAPMSAGSATPVGPS